jgi:transcriptional regulator with XRE-family HTH domain
MEDVGLKLKRAREKLNLRFREVEEASQQIAAKWNNDEFLVALSRLSDIENRGTVPSIFRIYSLCTIYRLNFIEVLRWYGVDLSQSVVDALITPLPKTHPIDFPHEIADPQVDASLTGSALSGPLAFDPSFDLRRTTYLSRMIEKWGTLPLQILNGQDFKTKRYAFIGSEDWFMYPILRPGSLLLIDDTIRKPASNSWTSEFERPIYFFEHRNGYACSWCTLSDKQLFLVPHPASLCETQIYNYPQDIVVLGKVTGVAMQLDESANPRTRS